ncbi:MAG: hypothetical protein KDJ99_05265 [Candidatus Competibacteraceae bacterium]|nr:hypothetical protein [Candidatus Competibacteraceae bacterium]
MVNEIPRLMREIDALDERRQTLCRVVYSAQRESQKLAWHRRLIACQLLLARLRVLLADPASR